MLLSCLSISYFTTVIILAPYSTYGLAALTPLFSCLFVYLFPTSQDGNTQNGSTYNATELLVCLPISNFTTVIVLVIYPFCFILLSLSLHILV